MADRHRRNARPLGEPAADHCLAARATFDGYDPGTWLNVRVRSRVTAGAGDWSSVIKIMVV